MARQVIRAYTQWFLDRPKVQALLSPAERKYLGRGGALVMREARKSIKRKGHARNAPKQGAAKERWLAEVRERPASPPGTPPYTHTGLLREAILFALEPAARRVVVGPTRAMVDDIGALHEYGGWRYGRRYPSRPYMQPALRRVTPRLPELWRNAITYK